ncbi:hypothetical protein INR49_012875, partial [Caranx melampygus]
VCDVERETGGQRERESEREGARERGEREGEREREIPRWIDRQMQRGRNLELQYSAYSSRILPSCDDDDDDRRCWTWVDREKEGRRGGRKKSPPDWSQAAEEETQGYITSQSCVLRSHGTYLFGSWQSLFIF